MTDPVLFYGGEFCFGLSNFASFTVDWRGRMWMTSEHAYQAAKFDDPAIIDKIHAATSAYAALKLAEQYKDHIRSTWSDEKLSVMEDIIRHKLAQHPYIKRYLLESGDATLVEDSPKDSFWGRGPDWKGQNHLGRLWMKLRSELQAA